jgi:hypothetical protein
VCLLCEWSWAIKLSAATVIALDTPSTGLIYNTTLHTLYEKWREISTTQTRAQYILTTGLQRAPDWNCFHLPPKQHLHEHRLELPVRGPEAAESLIDQLHSQSKHTTPRHKNRKIQHENAV